MVRVPAAKYTGSDDSTTFLLYDPTDDSYDKKDNPYLMFESAISRAVHNGKTSTGRKIDPDWNKLVLGRDRKISRPTYLYYIQGLTYQKGTNIYAPPKRRPLGWKEDEPIAVHQLPTGAGKQLRKLLNEKNEDWEGPEDDWDNAYLYNDLLNWERGRFICVYNPEKFDPDGGVVEDNAEEEYDEGDMESAQVNDKGGKDDDDDFKGYAVRIEENFVNRAERKRYSAKIPEEMPYNRFNWWFTEGEEQGLLYIPTELEVVQYMARCFRSQKKALEYGLDDRQDLLLDESVQAIIRARTSASMPDDGDDYEDEDSRTVRRDPTAELEDDEYDEEYDEGEENEEEYYEDESEEEEADDEDADEESSEEEEEYYDEDDEDEEGEEGDEEYEEDSESDYDDDDEAEGDAEDEDEYYDDEDEQDATEDEGELEDDPEDVEDEELEEPDEREKELEAQMEAAKRAQKRTSKKKTSPKPPAKKKAAPKKGAKKAAPKKAAKKTTKKAAPKKAAKKKTTKKTTKKKSTKKRS
jgi:hypothetical protein